jgi:predicted nuclease of predicted toxin-antitoxin system
VRVLLDENLPLDFGAELPEFDVTHIESLGRKGVKNGELLDIARSGYDVLITLDRGILHQHSHAGHKLAIICIRVPDSKPDTIRSRAGDVLKCLESTNPGVLVELSY